MEFFLHDFLINNSKGNFNFKIKIILFFLMALTLQSLLMLINNQRVILIYQD